MKKNYKFEKKKHFFILYNIKYNKNQKFNIVAFKTIIFLKINS